MISALGAGAYVIVMAAVIYYEMVVKGKDTLWLQIYLPLAVIVFLIVALTQSR